MKKYLFAITFLFIAPLAYANMASPYIEGSQFCSPLTSRNIRILKETIDVSINSNFSAAVFDVQYQIQAKIGGKQIPLLFEAKDCGPNFKVWVDSKEVMLKEIPEEIQLAKGSPFEPFSSSFGISEESNRVMDYLTSGNYRYFEIDIDAGIHIVKVMYSATFWINNSEWVKERSFRYALSPAKYWQSYGTLDITINSTEFKKSYTTSLGSPSEQSSPTLAHWHFMSLPEEDIIISYTPEVSLFATIMIAIGPFGLGSLLLLIAIMLHGCVIKRYRRHDVTTRFPWVVIVGSLIIPLFVLISIIGFFPLIDICIGTEAGGHHGYTFLIILLYPVIALLYWLIMWFYDWMLRRKTKG